VFFCVAAADQLLPVALLTTLASAKPTFAYNLAGHYWDTSVVRYNYAKDLDSDYLDELDDALTAWNKAVQKYVAFGRDTQKSRLFIFKEADYGNTGWNAETSVKVYTGSDIVQTATISPNSYYMDNMGAFDLQGVFAHELGHVLGLDHVKDKNQVMCTAADGRKVNKPGDDDIDGIKAIY
jgi:predicted Zn-dependent protease